MAKATTIHYAGALRIEGARTVTRIGPGFAACCSGSRATAIRARGANTYDRAAVTCRACLRRMAAAEVGHG